MWLEVALTILAMSAGVIGIASALGALINYYFGGDHE
jgi:hypothetical protein